PAVGAVPDAHDVDGELPPEIELPPRVALGRRVRHRTRRPVPGAHAVERTARLAAERDARLARRAAPRDRSPAALHLDLGEREDARLARELEAHEAPDRGLALPRFDADRDLVEPQLAGRSPLARQHLEPHARHPVEVDAAEDALPWTLAVRRDRAHRLEPHERRQTGAPPRLPACPLADEPSRLAVEVGAQARELAVDLAQPLRLLRGRRLDHRSLVRPVRVRRVVE